MLLVCWRRAFPPSTTTKNWSCERYLNLASVTAVWPNNKVRDRVLLCSHGHQISVTCSNELHTKYKQMLLIKKYEVIPGEKLLYLCVFPLAEPGYEDEQRSYGWANSFPSSASYLLPSFGRKMTLTYLLFILFFTFALSGQPSLFHASIHGSSFLDGHYAERNRPQQRGSNKASMGG